MKIIVLLNNGAGRFAAPGIDLPALVAAAFEQRGIDARIDCLAGEALEDAARRAVTEAKEGSLDAVVIGGGDGTVRTLAAAAANSGVTIGILPLGTLNHLARDLGIPFDIDGAADVVAAGHHTDIDLGSVNGNVFINNSSVGVYPSLVLDRERRMRADGLGKKVAMIFAVLRMFRRFTFRRLTIAVSGVAKPFRTPCVFVGNNAYELQGVHLGTRERLNEGKLWVYVAKQQSRLALLWVAVRAVLGLIKPDKEFQMLRVTEIALRSRTSRLLVALDGEVLRIQPPLHYRAMPGALKIFVPAAASAV